VSPSGLDLFNAAIGRALAAAEKVRAQLLGAGGASGWSREALRIRALLGISSAAGGPGAADADTARVAGLDWLGLSGRCAS